MTGIRMRFRVVSENYKITLAEGPICYLKRNDSWNDWFKYQSVFELVFINEDGEEHSAGSVKIGTDSMDISRSQADEAGFSKTPLEESFSELPDNYFSLGQSENYYETLLSFGDETRVSILSSLRDLAFCPTHAEKFKDLNVYIDSITRNISESVISRRFHALAIGQIELTPFAFCFTKSGDARYSGYSMDFDVNPCSSPPTNLHAIIGRNGVGKTNCLRSMVTSVVNPGSINASFVNCLGEDSFPFRRIVSVSFSAFDPFPPVPSSEGASGSVEYQYIGLKSESAQASENVNSINAESIYSSFIEAATLCKQGIRRDRWAKALGSLKTDPIFSDSCIEDIASKDSELSAFQNIFDRLSSGHKIILLTITRLVAATEEKTLILLDEPEAHLHPPLLGSFMRCLSDLLIDRNAVAVIATHSPVVLQEVPASCSYIMTRSGGEVLVFRPTIETFGESIGILTSEIFGLEVVESGFHQFISELANKHPTYQEAIGALDGRLGSVGRAILRLRYTQA
jgi:ABC-type cobalamin/Fe3+-siderophores transport system ATPase subunit